MESALACGKRVRSRGYLAARRCPLGGTVLTYMSGMTSPGVLDSMHPPGIRLYRNGAVHLGAPLPGVPPVVGRHSFCAGYANNAGGQTAAAIGYNNTASGTQSVAIGLSNQATGGRAVAMGDSCLASNTSSVAFGLQCQATGASSLATGSQAFANRGYHRAHGGGGGLGRHQVSDVILGGTTTDAAVTEIIATGLSTRCIIATSTAYLATIRVIARAASGADHKAFERRCLIYNNAGTTALEGAVQTIGTDIASAGAAAWDVTISADNTNDALKVEVTGAAATTIRWTVAIHLTEVIH